MTYTSASATPVSTRAAITRRRRVRMFGTAAALAALLGACSAGGSESLTASGAADSSSTTTVGADAAGSSTTTTPGADQAGGGVTTPAPASGGNPAPAPTAPAPAPTAPATTAPMPSPGPTITEFWTPDDIDCHNGFNQTFTARWATENATEVVISIDGPGAYATYPPDGETSLPFGCGSSHTFLLTARSADGRTATRTVTLQPRNVQPQGPPETMPEEAP